MILRPLTSLLSSYAGVPAPALEFMLCILAGYPISLGYRKFIWSRSAEEQYIYLAGCGIAIVFALCGVNVYHSVVSVLLAYCICKFCAGTTLSVVLAYSCFMGHLLIGYWFFESREYDFNWTTPHCILTLRLICLVMNVYDGHQTNQDEVKPDQKLIALSEPPSLLECFAYAYFPSACLIGPQFPLMRLRDMVNGKMLDSETKKPFDSALVAVSECLVPGFIYLAIHLVGHGYYPNKYMYSQEFFEGSNVLFGISYAGKDDQGQHKWDGLKDFRIRVWELGYSFQHLIDSFNCNTNLWAKNYIFRRLRWMGNRSVSQGVTLAFLALWHGYHLGYFVIFAVEFGTMQAEAQMIKCLDRLPAVKSWLNGPGFYAKWVVCKMITTSGAAFGFLSFGLVTKERWWLTVKSLYFTGWLIYWLICPVGFYLLLKYVLPKPAKKDQDKKGQ